MLSKFRPEPRVPLALSLICLLAIGTHEAGRYEAQERSAAHVTYLRTIIDAELTAHEKNRSYSDVSGAQSRRAVTSYVAEHHSGGDFSVFDSVQIKPIVHNGLADAFSLSVATPDADACQRLASFPDSRVVRTRVNGQIVQDREHRPSGYALSRACTANSTVTLEVVPPGIEA